jgi:YHS domain-containing protein
VPLLGEGENEQETHIPAPQASRRTQVAAEPEVIDHSKPYDRNKPFTPPTGEAPPVPHPAAAPALRHAPAVTRKAAADVPLLTSPDSAQPDNRSAEPSPYSGLKLTPEESEHRVARGLGGPTEESANGFHEANKAPGVPDSADSASGTEIPGLRGYCLVYLREHRQYVAGQAQFRSQYHSKSYTFSSIDAKREFDRHPDRYAPVQDGNDIVAATQGANVAGTLDHAAWFKGRLYLFSSAENMAAFWKAPKTYAR